MAANIANGVYGIRTTDNIPDAFVARGVGGLEQNFDLGRSQVVGGRSGGRVVNQDSGFSLVMPFTGGRQGQWTVAVRGTVSGYDWVTNLNGAAESGPTGNVVHAGFKRVYDTIIGDVQSAFQGANPTTVHVVGHSLGGALANLVAARLDDIGLADIKLYTFGAPRAGYSDFSRSLTQRLNPDSIFRVYDISDVVPMIPLFPFIHAPATADGFRIGTTNSVLSLNAHYMSSYTPGVGDAQWGGLRTAGQAVESMLSVDHWIDVAKQNVSFPGSSLAFFAIGKALGALLGFIRNSLGLAIAGASTLLDRLAGLLYHAARISAEIMERILDLMSTALRFAGHAAVSGAEITAAFISWVLSLLMRPIAAIGNTAVRTFYR
jgi:pimeloyl-ACP methyl ester carboxylesterase